MNTTQKQKPVHTQALIDQQEFEASTRTAKKWLEHIVNDVNWPESERSSARILLKKIQDKDKELAAIKAQTVH